MSGQTYPPDNENELARQRLILAVKEDNVERLSQLFTTTSLKVDDATRALGHALNNPAVMQCLLVHGADPRVFDKIERVRSAEVLRLLVDFGYDIATTGHLIIQ